MSRIPAAAQDLKIQQRGTDVILRLSYPSVTVGGTPLGEIESIDVWEASREVPEFFLGGMTEAGDADSSLEAGTSDAEEDGTPADDTVTGFLFQVPDELEEAVGDKTPLEDRIPLDVGTFAGLAKRRLVLSGAEIDAAVSGDQLVFRLPLGSQVKTDTDLVAYAVQTNAGRKRVSAFSNIVKLIPRQAPTPPSALEVTAQETAIKIQWEGDSSAEGFRVYRKDAQSRDFGEPLALKSSDQTEHLDASARFGNRYVYAVTTVVAKKPLIESAIAAQQEVHYRDKFAPRAPRNLVAFASEGRVRLLWDAPTGADEDVAGYRVFRATREGEFERISEQRVLAQEFLDTDVVSGQTYRYKVRAVDKAKNRGDFSPETEVRVP